MLQPKLSLKPTTAFELPNIGLFAIILPLYCFFFFFLLLCYFSSSVGFWVEEGGIKMSCIEFIVRCDVMQIQSFLWKSDKKWV